ncbi:hypothetical protein E2O03_011860 [Candidatus Magnetomonas plexicatena]|nr:hypothetical protein E2O03_011860 [Nitrospirales bacterium LBB_01]
MFAVILPSCSGGSGAKELFDTAELEVVQNNKEHAVTLYQEVVSKYPDSEYAKKAQDKLSQLKNGK